MSDTKTLNFFLKNSTSTQQDETASSSASNKADKKKIKPWRIATRAPKINESRNSELDSLRARRQAKYEAQTKMTIGGEKSDYIPKVVSAASIKKQERKIDARKYFKLRFKGRQTLQNAKFGTLTPVQRLGLFNRHHKCPCHKLRYNSHELVDGKYRWTCDRKDKPETRTLYTESRCDNCSRPDVYMIKKSKCICMIFRCDWCKYQTYTHNEIQSIECHCDYVEAEPLPNPIKRSQQTWKSKADRKKFFEEMKNLAAGVETLEIVAETLPGFELTVEQAGLVELAKKVLPSAPKRTRIPKIKVSQHGGAVSAVKDGADIIKTTVVSILQKIKSAVKSGITYFKNFAVIQKASGIMASIVNYFKNFLESIDSVLFAILETFLQNGLLIPAFMRLFADILFSETRSWSRLLAFGAMCTHIVFSNEAVFEKFEDGCGWLFNILKSWLGFEDEVPNTTSPFRVDAETAAAATATTKPWGLDSISTYENSNVDPKLYASKLISVDEAVPKLETPVDDKPKESTRMDGFSIREIYTSLMNFIVRKLNIPNFDMNNAMSGMRSFNTLFTTSRNLLCLFQSLLAWLPQCIQSLFCGSDPKYMLSLQLKDKNSYLYQMGVMATAVQVAIFHQDGDAVNLNAQKYEELRLAFHTKLVEDNVVQSLESLKYVSELDVLASARGWQKKTVIEPFVLRTCGDPGVGKSTFSHAFISACFPDKSVEEIDAMTYSRNPVAESWDGCIYGRHKVCIMDDYNQDRKEKDLQEMILIASRPAYRAPFASIAFGDKYSMGIKGDIVDFSLIVCNGNTAMLNPSTLNSREAINRRKDIMFEFQMKPGYTKVEDDFSHAIVKRLGVVDGEDYKEIWRMEGLQGLKRACWETAHAYADKMELSRKLQVNTKNMLFTNMKIDPSAWGCKDDSNALMQRLLGVESADDKRRREQLKRKDECLNGKTPVMTEDVESYFGTKSSRVIVQAHSGAATLVSILATIRPRYEYKYAADLFASFVSGSMYGVATTLGLTTTVLLMKYSEGWMKSVGAFVGITTALALLYKLRSYRNETEAHSGEAKTNAHKTTVVVHGASTAPLLQSWTKNCFKLAFAGIHTNGIFVKGNVALLNAHLFWETHETGRKWKAEGSKMKLYSSLSAEPMELEFESKRLIQIVTDSGERDMVLYKFPPIVNSRPTIVNHFWDGTTLLTSRRVASIIHKWQNVEIHHGEMVKDQIEAVYQAKRNGVNTEIEQHFGGIISVPSTAGDCGSLVMVDDDLLMQKIIGINVGAARRTCSTTLYITREILERHLTKLEELERVFERAEMHVGWTEPRDEDLHRSGLTGVLSLYAISDKPAIPSGRSKIRPSPLFDQVAPHVTEPCIVNMRDDRLKEDTYLAAMNKYGQPSKPFREEIMRRAGESIKQQLSSIKTIRLKRILTQAEAINGIVDMPYLDSLDMTTSPGFPFTTMGIVGEKRQLFEGEVGSLEPNKVLQEHIDLLLARLRKGILPDYPYTTTLKDERKPIEDVAKGKVRMFSMNNVALVVIMRRYFLPTIAHLYQCRHESFLAVGLDKTSGEWDQLVRYLLEVSPKIADADYKKFDTRAQIDCRMWVNKILLEDYFKGDDLVIAETLLHYDSQALFQFKKYIVMLASGTASGSILTVIIGSLLNEMYIRCAWMEMAPINMKDLKYYMRNVRTKNYGDDLALSCNEAVTPFFRDELIAEFLSQYDIEMTPGTKAGNWGHREVTEFIFLKNRSRLWMGRYVPLMQDYAEPINWIRVGVKAEPPELACENNCNSALRAAFFYGKDTYNELRAKIHSVRPKYILLEFDALFNEFTQLGKLCDVEGTFTFGSARMSPTSMVKYAEANCNKESENLSELSLIEKSKMLFNELNLDEYELIERVEMHSGDVFDCDSMSTAHKFEERFKALRNGPTDNDLLVLDYCRELQSHIPDRERRAFVPHTYVPSLTQEEQWWEDAYRQDMCEGCSNHKPADCIYCRMSKDFVVGRCYMCFVYGCSCEYDDELKARQAVLYRGPRIRFATTIAEGSYLWSKVIEAWLFNRLMHVQPWGERVEMHSGGTLDEPASILDAKSGVILSQQETPATMTRVENRARADNARSEAYNNDKPWDLVKMLERWNAVVNVTWAATDAPGKQIAVFDLLTDLLTNDISSTPFTRFIHFWMKRMKLHVECIGYRYMRGRLLLVIRNTMIPKKQLLSTEFSRRNAVTLPHVVLDPSAGTTAELQTPFTFNRQYIDLVAGDCFGQASLIVLNQLVPGTTGDSTSIIKLYLSIDMPIFKQPRPGATTLRQKIAGVENVAMNAIVEEDEDTEHVLEELKKKVIHYQTKLEREREIVEMHAGIVGTLVDAGAGALKELVKDVNPVEVISDALGALLDKVQIGENIQPLVRKDQQYLSNTRNIDYTEYLSADPSAQQMTDDGVFSAGVNEMMIDEIIKKKPGFMGTYSWKHTDPVGKVIFSDNVGPMSEFPVSFDKSKPTELIPLDLIASKFTYWRGGIVYIIELVGTPFHEGKIDMNYHPTIPKSIADTYTALNSVTQYSKTHFMRNAENVIGVMCPFLGDTPVKGVWSGQDLSTVPGTSGDERFVDYFSGSFEVRVSTILNAPDTVSPDIEINVYKLAASDFEFFMNTFTGGSITWLSGGETRKEVVSMHSGAIIDRNMPFDQMPVTTLAVGSGEASDVPESHFGEYFKSLRDIAKRYHRLFRGIQEFDTASLTADQVNGVDPILVGITGDPTTMPNFIGDVAKLYRSFRGPMCFKISIKPYMCPKDSDANPMPINCRMFMVPQASRSRPFNAATGSLFPCGIATIAGQTSGMPVPLGYASGTHVGEFKIPFLMNKTSGLLFKDYDKVTDLFFSSNFYDPNNYVAVYMEGIPYQTAVAAKYVYWFNVEVDVAFGDETAMGVWTGLPSVYIRQIGGVTIAPDAWEKPTKNNNRK